MTTERILEQEKKKAEVVKVHLCCGDVYLGGYINVDRVGSSAYQKLEGTTLENYYTHKLGTNKQPIIDRWMDINHRWEFEPESVDEFVMISAFEHFSRVDAERLLDRVYSSLKYGGKFKFDFPDIEETVLKFKDDPEYMMRLIYGSQKNDGGFHRWGYTKESIWRKLALQPWLDIQFGDIVKHDYPMLGCTCTK
jgi:predicted SAM-dependent methyltransferase